MGEERYPISILSVPQVLLSLSISGEEVVVGAGAQADRAKDHPVPGRLILPCPPVPHEVSPPSLAPVDLHMLPEGDLVGPRRVKMGKNQGRHEIVAPRPLSGPHRGCRSPP